MQPIQIRIWFVNCFSIFFKFYEEGPADFKMPEVKDGEKEKKEISWRAIISGVHFSAALRSDRVR
jgi:hypothetical protein